MSRTGAREVEHDIQVAASAGEVYRLLADVEDWPRIFPPTIHVGRLGQVGDQERIQIWATANGEAKQWTSRRRLDADALRIDFRQEASAAPVAAMGGSWVIEPVGSEECRVRLLHDYRAVDGDPQKLAWIDEAVDRNSQSELAALKASAELASGPGGKLRFAFEDEVRIDGSAMDSYDFLNEAQLWPERLPHVARAALTEDTPGLQVLEMDTRTKDGSTHTTQSVRVCFPHHHIVYKQIGLPALMSLHTGSWRLTEDAAGVLATSQHTVVINPDNIAQVLGPDADVPQATDYIRSALSANSRSTLEHAKQYAESRR